MIQKIIQNNCRFLTPALINQCFFRDKITHVDKQVCGNGFSTSFLKLTPAKGEINIMIAPNKGVLIEKHKLYLEGNIETENRIKFFYKESKDSDFENADVLVFVADSFLLMNDKTKEIAHKIDKVLLDEFHSIEQDSSFRFVLVDFIGKVKNICKSINTSIVTVTATPNLFSKVDILINNKEIKENNIVLSQDREKSLKAIKTRLKKKENVLVATNSASALYNLRNYKNIIEANFIMGESLFRSLSKKIVLKQNSESNLTIISAKGFEGIDNYYKNASVYFLEDRGNNFETFYISNLYQAFNRVRNGASYIEYNRLDLSNKRKDEFKDINTDVTSFIDAKLDHKGNGFSTENKQTQKYKKYHSFVIFEQDSNGIFSIKRNDVSINLYKEKILYDKPFPAPEFEEFLKIRKINVLDIKEVTNRSKRMKTREQIIIDNLYKNSKLIDELDLFGSDYSLRITDLIDHTKTLGNDIRFKYLKVLKTYLIEKNYKKERVQKERENIAIELLSNEEKFNDLVSNVTKEYNTRSIDKYGVKASRIYREAFKTKSNNEVCKFILTFVNENIYTAPKWIANRNYNLLTTIGINEIKIIGKVFDTSIYELDIRNCFPRLLYAINGLELPINFYGENKKNKLNINIFLNNFFYDDSKKTEKKIQRNNAIVKFRKFGFDETIIKYLIDNYFEPKFRGDLFNQLSFYEKKIISKLKEELKSTDNNGVIRRHDSLIIFNNKTDLTFLNSYEYMNVKGWFNVKETPVIKMIPKEDNSFNDFIEEMELDNRINKMKDGEYYAYINNEKRPIAL